MILALACAASVLLGEPRFVLFVFAAAAPTFLMLHGLDRQWREIVELRRSEESSKRQAALLQNTLENFGEGLSVVDRYGRVIAWNSRFGELLDLPIELIANATIREVITFQAQRGDFGPVDTKQEVRERLDRFHRDVPTCRERVTRSGRVLQLRRRAMDDGGVVTVYSDVTEIKAAEREMRHARIQAEQANHTKSEFLANMSHELRTPLNAIIGFSEVIFGEMLGPIKNTKYLDYIKDINSSGLHLLSIISDVLDMSKIEAGKLELSEEDVVVQPIIGEALRMLEERAQTRNIELVSRIPEDDIVIWGDERAMKQVLLNLLSNAIKFSKEGGRVTIRTAILDHERIVIEVEDSGIGMTDEEQERALHPFGQAKSVTTRAYGGMGLGLPITKGLVEAHGGTLVIESAVGKGTLVRIELPRRRTELAATLPGVASLMRAEANDPITVR